jgi:hypothetical protein
MRRITMVALATMLALMGAACGDDDSSNADTAATSDGDTSDGDTSGGDTAGGVTDAGFLDEDCQFLLAGAFQNPLAAATPGSDADVGDYADQLDAIAENAPDEIKDAMETLAAGYDQLAEALQGIDLSDPQSYSDPEVQQQLEELSAVFDDEEYQAATEEIGTYIAENCSAG